MENQKNVIPFFDLSKSIAEDKNQYLRALEEVLDSGQFIGGSQVEDFEKKFSEFLGISKFVGVGNGLDAIRLSLEAAGIGRGDEVIVPGFSFVATWLAVLQAGAVPVAVDVELNTGTIEMQSISEAITSRTKAIIPVHLFGGMADMKKLMPLAASSNLVVVEDCAQSHGAETEGQKAGTFGSFGAFSFYPTKNLGALGDAGGVSTSTAEAAEKLISLRSYGSIGTKYNHAIPGWNSRLDPAQAAFLQVGLAKLESRNARRIEIAGRYLDALGVNGASAINSHRKNESVWHHFVIRTHAREKLVQEFRNVGISTDTHYPYYFRSVPAITNSLPHNAKQEGLVNSKTLSEQVLSMPMSPWMTDDQVSKVCSALASKKIQELVTHV